MTHVLTVCCVSKRGIVAAITDFPAERGCNITDASQLDDVETGRVFARIGFVSKTGAASADLREGFASIAESFGLEWGIHAPDYRMKVVIMVSHFGHCLNDLLYRRRIGALPIEIMGVISNHMSYQKVAVNHGLPFHHIKVTKRNKPEAEAQLLQLVEVSGAQLIVLARSMQIFSDAMCRKMSVRIIDIHHSFMPSFKRATPASRLSRVA